MPVREPVRLIASERIAAADDETAPVDRVKSESPSASR